LLLFSSEVITQNDPKLSGHSHPLAFFTAQGLFEGKSASEIKDKLSNGYTTALVGNYKVINH
jgi:hypothetical protein